MLSIWIAAATYTATLLVGVTAAVRNISFGRLHHVMYFLSWVTLLWACIDTLDLLLLGPAIAMVILPRTRGGTRNHVIVGSFGLAAWAVVLLAYFFMRTLIC